MSTRRGSPHPAASKRNVAVGRRVYPPPKRIYPPGVEDFGFWSVLAGFGSVFGRFGPVWVGFGPVLGQSRRYPPRGVDEAGVGARGAPGGRFRETRPPKTPENPEIRCVTVTAAETSPTCCWLQFYEQRSNPKHVPSWASLRSLEPLFGISEPFGAGSET
jgi:hypothetical protein